MLEMPETGTGRSQKEPNPRRNGVTEDHRRSHRRSTAASMVAQRLYQVEVWYLGTDGREEWYCTGEEEPISAALVRDNNGSSYDLTLHTLDGGGWWVVVMLVCPGCPCRGGEERVFGMGFSWVEPFFWSLPCLLHSRDYGWPATVEQ